MPIVRVVSYPSRFGALRVEYNGLLWPVDQVKPQRRSDILLEVVACSGPFSFSTNIISICAIISVFARDRRVLRVVSRAQRVSTV